MYETSERVGRDESERPQDEQNDDDCGKHAVPPFECGR
jgi:hypothetical protein